MGPSWRPYLTFLIFFQWFTTLPVFIMASTSSLISALANQVDWCYYEWGAIIMLALSIPVQKRTLHSLSIISILSDIAIVIVLAMLLVDFLSQTPTPDDDVNDNPDTSTSWGIPTSTDFITGYGKLSSFIFAYMGQSMLFEIMREMRNFEEFPKTLSVAQLMLVIVYFITTVIGYYVCGSTVATFLPFSLEDGALKTTLGLILAFHIAAAYLIQNQPLCNRIHRKFFPSTVQDDSLTGGRAHWLLITISIMVASYLLANLIPFFADFTNIVGSMIGGPIMFFFPALFYLKGCQNHGIKITLFDKVCCLFLLVFLSPTTFFLGTYAAFHELVDDWSTFGLPFSCYLVGY